MKTNGNDPVGIIDWRLPDGSGKVDGLRKREYFAAMAMQALIASYEDDDRLINPEICANKAVNYANALIEALNKE